MEAVLTTRTTLPLREESGYSLPFSVGWACQERERCTGGGGVNVLSLGLKSKKVVADDMVAKGLLAREPARCAAGAVGRWLEMGADAGVL